MVQKSGDHQLRSIVEIPLFTTGFSIIPGGDRLISSIKPMLEATLKILEEIR